MKRGTPHHPKATMLQTSLGLPQYAVVGILESLWHFTARYAPAGNIGKYNPAVIARAIGWEGDADTLINALVEAGWLDRHEAGLLVHDWSKHCDDTCDKYLADNGLVYADGKPTRRKLRFARRPHDKSRQVATESRTILGKPEPEPEPEPEPIPVPKPARGKGRMTSNRERDDANSLSPPPEVVGTCLDTDTFREAWSDWEQHRREIKKPLTPTSIKQQLRQFQEIGHERSIAAIRFTVGKGWQGIEEPNTNFSRNGSPTPENSSRVRTNAGKYDGVARTVPSE